MFILSSMLVACDKNENNNEAEAGAGSEPVIEVPVIDPEILKDIEAVKVYLESVSSEFVIEETHETYFADINKDDIDEVFIVNEAMGPIMCIGLNETGEYTIIPSTVEASTTHMPVVDKQFVIVDQLVDNGHNSKVIENIYRYTEEGIVSIRGGNITLEHKKMIDPIVMSSTLTTHTTVNEASWFSFTINSQVQYIDELENVYDFQTITTTYALNKTTNVYEITVTVEGEYDSLDEFIASINYYGTDESLETFEQVYKAGDLEATIRYYGENRYDFVEGHKEAFADGIIMKLKEVYNFHRNPAFGGYDNVEEGEDENGLTINFLRNDTQTIEKDQTVYGFFKKYLVTEGVVEEAGYQAAFKDIELSNAVYAALLDADVFVDKNAIKMYMINVIGFEAFNASSVSMPRVLIDNTSDAEAFTGARKATLLIPMTLLNEPVKIIRMEDLREGQYIGDMKITYMTSNDEKYNVNVQGRYDIEGMLKYNSTDSEYYIDIAMEPLARLTFNFGDDVARVNLLSGNHTVINEDLTKFIDSETLAEIEAGGEVMVAGRVWLAFAGGFEHEDSRSVAVDLKDLYIK